MTRQSKELYRTGNTVIDTILARISDRLDLLEGLRPSLEDGYFTLENKQVNTTTDVISSGDVSGTENQIIVTINVDETITLSTPQDIHTDADVEFDSAILDDLTASRMVSSNASKKLVSIAALSAWIAGTANQISITDDGDGSITIAFASPTYLASAANIALGNYSEVETDGTYKMNGDSTVWNDLQFQVTVGKQPSSSAPTWATLTTNTGEYGFGVNEYLDLASNELFHSWKEGTAGNFHLHISIPTANSSGSRQYAKFTLYVAYINSSGIWTETSLTDEEEIPDGSSALQNFYLDMGDVSFAGLLIGTQVKVRIKRIAATGGTEYGSDVFIHQVGCHLENDTIGSRTEGSK